jgi:hypothetical protein
MQSGFRSYVTMQARFFFVAIASSVAVVAVMLDPMTLAEGLFAIFLTLFAASLFDAKALQRQ